MSALNKIKKYNPLILAIMLTLITLVPSIINPHRLLDEDPLERIFFIHSLKDSSIFQDKLSNFYPNYPYNMPVVVFSILILSYIIPLIFIPLIWTLIFSIGSGIILYKIGKKLSGKRLGIILLFVGLAYFLSFDALKGIERTAGIFFILLFTLALIEKSKIKIFLSILALGLTYPPFFILASLTTILTSKKNIKITLIAGVIVTLTILPFIGGFEFLDSNNSKNIEALGENGNNPLFFKNPIKGFFTEKSDLSPGLYLFTKQGKPKLIINEIFFLILFSLIILAFKEKINKNLKLLLAAGIFLYIISFLTLTKLPLFVPNRFLRFPLEIILLIQIAKKINTTFKKNKIIAITLIIIFGAFFIPLTQSGNQNCNYQEIYQKLGNGIIVGNPAGNSIIDCVPLFTKKTAFVTKVTSNSYFPTQYKIAKQRLEETFKAYYSNNKTAIENFCKQNNITQIIVEKNKFKKEFFKSEMFFEPFNTKIKNYENNSFALLEWKNRTQINENIFIAYCNNKLH